jgi:proline iminopeptidase
MTEKKTLQIGKFKLGYEIEGTGPATMVIGSSIYYPRTFSQKLRRHLRLIFVDHRGFAPRPASLQPSEFTLDVILNDIEYIRKKLNLPRIIIAGHSGHGYMALEYAKKYPAVVSHVVLLAMSPDGSAESFAAADRYFQESVCPKRKALLSKNLTTLQTEIDANPNNAFIMKTLKFGPMIWYDENFDATKLWQDVEVVPEIMDYLWGKTFREIDITKDLNKITAPIFLGLGRYDYWNPPHLWETIRSHFKDLTVRVFEESGHTPQYEEATLFDEELLHWLFKEKIQ